MLLKTKINTLIVIFVSLVIFYVLKINFDKIFLPTLSFISAFFISGFIGFILLFFSLHGIKKVILEKNILQEKNTKVENILVSLKKQIEEKEKMLVQKTESLSTLNRINKALSSIVDLDKILELILDALQKDLKFDRVILFLSNEKLKPKKTVGFDKNIDINNFVVSLEDKTNFLVKTFFDGRPKIITDIKEQQLPENFSQIYKNIYPNSVAIIPLVSKDIPVGLIIVDNISSKRDIEERDIRSLSIFTNQVALAIENARLFEMEKNFSQELQKQVEIAKKNLEIAQSQLIKSERLAALGEMSAIVAHEVRNPMASIRASAQRISKKISDTDPAKKYTVFIIQEVDRLERVVKDILTFSREPEPQKQPTNINALIKDTLYFLQSEIKQVQARVIENFDSTLSNINIDPALIKQVLLNILQNALNFMADRERRELKVVTYSSDGNIKIEISDTGPGIPEENLEKIFEPFFTTKPRGTGLGLAISSRLVESHKGKISVESKLGFGSTFTITLPI